MAYNKEGYYLRAKRLQELTAQYYEPGRQDRCLKWVWQRHVYPVYGIGYRPYLRYIKAKNPKADPTTIQLQLFD